MAAIYLPFFSGARPPLATSAHIAEESSGSAKRYIQAAQTAIASIRMTLGPTDVALQRDR
jgi:hypothetical protein